MMNNKSFKHINEQVLKSTGVLLVFASILVCSLPQKNFALKLISSPSTKVITARNNDFNKEYREGRDLIAKGEWSKAAGLFNELIRKYPKNELVDAALYWLAFCYKKQNKFKEANETVDRLLKEYPTSSWAYDGRVMKLEISSAPEIIYTPIPTDSDRGDEIKLAAFQGLLVADTKKAIETLGEILTKNSNTSETLKQQMLRALRGPFLLNEAGLNELRSGVSNQFVPLLRETLAKGFQNESNIKIRKEIIYALIGINDEQSARYLTEFYDSENNQEIKKEIINMLSSPFHYLSKIYSKPSPIREISLDKLINIIRSEKDVELRRLAFTNMQRLGGWYATEQAGEILAGLYEAEADEEFKILIIRTLPKIKQDRAIKKLLEIAKNDKSNKLRLEAANALLTSKDPEVLKFFQELIK